MNKAAWQDVKGAMVLAGTYEEAVKMMGDMNFLQARMLWLLWEVACLHADGRLAMAPLGTSTVPAKDQRGAAVQGVRC